MSGTRGTALHARGAHAQVIPLVPLGGNLSVGVAALSYNGLFTIGVLVDPVACPDAGVFTEGIARCFTQLLYPGQRDPRVEVPG